MNFYEELKIKELSNHISLLDYEIKLDNEDITELDQSENIDLLDYESFYDSQFDQINQ